MNSQKTLLIGAKKIKKIVTGNRAVKNYKVLYTQHAKNEMHNEEFGVIYENDVYEAVTTGKIIEEYLTDKPYPSVLIFGRAKKNKPLHIVCAYNEKENLTIIITVYQPDPKRWTGYTKRKRI